MCRFICHTPRVVILAIRRGRFNFNTFRGLCNETLHEKLNFISNYTTNLRFYWKSPLLPTNLIRNTLRKELAVRLAGITAFCSGVPDSNRTWVSDHKRQDIFFFWFSRLVPATVAIFGAVVEYVPEDRRKGPRLAGGSLYGYILCM